MTRDHFDTLNHGVWKCEFTCPTIAGGTAQFNLQPGIQPNQAGSWSKVGYKPARYTKGRFTIRFKLTERPKDQAVWWGLALWNDGPAADGSQFSEICFGYTTNQSFTNTQLRFESAHRGHDVSLKVDTGVDLYDGRYHTGTLEYGPDYAAFYLDDKLLKVINDESFIPSDPLELVIGPRLVTGSAPLQKKFTQTVDWVKIDA
ncbi:glycoside hydrolase family 16 protein [Kribbella deserti]|uniref:Glycoside hydrolase family 16 protein n=1 Tax=Kribbella deserti TaxID=1926257 RepID=A0ABV6QRV4_9ACTN